MQLRVECRRDGHCERRAWSGAHVKILTIQMECAPTYRPWRVQMLCGMISPAEMEVACLAWQPVQSPLRHGLQESLHIASTLTKYENQKGGR